MITLEPIGGLGNRMRAIASAVSLAETLATPLRIVWTRTRDCHSPFGALFEPLRLAHVVERGWWSNRLLRRLELRCGRYSRVIRQPDMRSLSSGNYDFHALASERSVFIQTFEQFYPLRDPGFGIFVPMDSLRADIDRVSSAFTGATIGIHIRRGDHQPSHRHSPTSSFIDRIAAEIDRVPETRCFLATDSEDVEVELRRRFGARILTQSKTFNRTTVAGIRGAVVDLYALARTQRIVGSFFSSFSETAAEIGRIPLEIIEIGSAR